MGLKDTKLAIFDMDGLLIDSERLIAQQWLKLADRYGLDRDKVWASCLACLGVTQEKVKETCLQFLGQDIPYEQYTAEVAEGIRRDLNDGPHARKKGRFRTAGILQGHRPSCRGGVFQPEARRGGSAERKRPSAVF